MNIPTLVINDGQQLYLTIVYRSETILDYRKMKKKIIDEVKKNKTVTLQLDSLRNGVIEVTIISLSDRIIRVKITKNFEEVFTALYYQRELDPILDIIFDSYLNTYPNTQTFVENTSSQLIDYFFNTHKTYDIVLPEVFEVMFSMYEVTVTMEDYDKGEVIGLVVHTLKGDTVDKYGFLETHVIDMKKKIPQELKQYMWDTLSNLEVSEQTRNNYKIIIEKYKTPEDLIEGLVYMYQKYSRG